MRLFSSISVILASLLLLSCSRQAVIAESGSLPPIFPDYCGVTVPSGIAPLDFCIPGSRITVEVKGADGAVLLHSVGRETSFHVRKWHEALKHAPLSVTVISEGTRYQDFCIFVSDDEIDYGLTYRLVPPGYQGFGHMSIRERRLSDFKERTLVDNKGIDGECVNCHTAFRTDPSSFSGHVRGSHSATVLHKDDRTDVLNTRTEVTGGFFVYPSWSADGRYIAYSINNTRQEFYSLPPRRVEVYDEKSDVIVYDTEDNRVLISPKLNTEDNYETHPTFSADGRTLYFCSCPAARMPESYADSRYSLYSIAFDEKTGSFGDELAKVVDADSLKISLAMPRASYDGNYILVTGCDFGTFPIWHKEADLYLYDTRTGSFGPVEEINSGDADSFHSWSSNSRWVVFSSRRIDGLYTRLYITHVDDAGHFTKPFVLPQRHPRKFYQMLPFSYNTPDFTSFEVGLPSRSLYKALKAEERKNVSVDQR